MEHDEITVKKLQVFLVFMQNGNMARTAEQLGQSTVSVHRALHSLEQGLGCMLFKRDGRKLLPLATAQHFAQHAETVLQALEEGIRQTRELAGFASQRLKLGALYSLTAGALPQILAGLKTRRPGLEVDLSLASNQTLLRGLQEGSLDAIMLATHQEHTPPGMVSIPLFEDEIYFAAPLGSAYQAYTEVSLQALGEVPFVALHADFATGKDFNQAFRQAGIHPKVVMRVGDIFSLINLVGGGLGYALLPRRVALFHPKVQLIPLAKPDRFSQQICLLLASKRERDPNLLALAAECRMAGRRTG